jgi:hypothetical protein
MATYDFVVVRRTISPAARTNGTVSGSAVDLGAYGADSGIATISAGVITDGSHVVSLEESDTGTGGWSAIPAGRLTGTPPTLTSGNSNTLAEVGFESAKQFVRVTLVTTGATTGGLFSANIVCGEPGSAPVSHA